MSFPYRSANAVVGKRLQVLMDEAAFGRSSKELAEQFFARTILIDRSTVELNINEAVLVSDEGHIG